MSGETVRTLCSTHLCSFFDRRIPATCDLYRLLTILPSKVCVPFYITPYCLLKKSPQLGQIRLSCLALHYVTILLTGPLHIIKEGV